MTSIIRYILPVLRSLRSACDVIRFNPPTCNVDCTFCKRRANNLRTAVIKLRATYYPTVEMLTSSAVRQDLPFWTEQLGCYLSDFLCAVGRQHFPAALQILEGMRDGSIESAKSIRAFIEFRQHNHDGNVYAESLESLAKKLESFAGDATKCSRILKSRHQGRFELKLLAGFLGTNLASLMQNFDRTERELSSEGL